jgi:hypothetical protein
MDSVEEYLFYLGKFTSAIVGSLCDDKYVVSLLMCICKLCLKMRYYETALGPAADSSYPSVLQYSLSCDTVAFHVFLSYLP